MGLIINPLAIVVLGMGLCFWVWLIKQQIDSLQQDINFLVSQFQIDQKHLSDLYEIVGAMQECLGQSQPDQNGAQDI